MISHDLEPLAGVTDHVAVLRRGKLAHEARRDPAARDAAGFSHEELKELYHRYGE